MDGWIDRWRNGMNERMYGWMDREIDGFNVYNTK